MTASAKILCTPLDLSGHYTPAPDPDTVRFEPEYLSSLRALPDGERTFRGVRFTFAPAAVRARWIAVAGATTTVPVTGSASHVVFAHACAPLAGQAGAPELDLWERAGEEIARYILVFDDGSEQSCWVRRRVEVNEWVPALTPPALIGVPHATFRPADWRGPHARQTEPTWGAPGSSSMQALPGTWADNQGGICNGNGIGESNYWLYAAAVEEPRRELIAIRLEPASPRAAADGLMIGAITLFKGSCSPFAHAPGRTWLITGNGIDESVAVDVDLGVARLPRRRAAPIVERDWLAAPFTGFGDGWDAPGADGVLVDITGSLDATVTIAGRDFALRDVAAQAKVAVDGITVRELGPLRTVRVAIRDRDGTPSPARIRVEDEFGRYLPPAGHRDEVNTAMMEDFGADVQLGSMQYAYVPPTFEIDLPLGATYWEIVRGFETEVLRHRRDVTEDTVELEFELDRWIDMRGDGWLSADTHVHFVPSPTAMLEARAEGLNIVNLLATQFGHLYTNVGDLMYGTILDEANETAVYIGSEQRQPLLGHMSLLKPGSPIFPFGHGGAPTSPFGTPLQYTMADWADRCRASGGLVVSPHFPFPYGEIVADVVLSKIDAIEIFGLTQNPDGPRVRDYYRLLNCGYRLPLVGGTDKLSAGTVVGAVRTYARLAPNESFGFDNWAAAVRAGRTFQTSGPILMLRVDGKGLGQTLTLRKGGGSVRVRATAQAPYDVGRLQIVVNGRVAAEAESLGAHTVEIDESIPVTDTSWIAARCATAFAMRTAFPTAVGAHTSPVYVRCGERDQLDPDDAHTLLRLIAGTRGWAAELAVWESAEHRRRVLGFLDSAYGVLAARLSGTRSLHSAQTPACANPLPTGGR